jgi:hypothetical protein
MRCRFFCKICPIVGTSVGDKVLRKSIWLEHLFLFQYLFLYLEEYDLHHGPLDHGRLSRGPLCYVETNACWKPVKLSFLLRASIKTVVYNWSICGAGDERQCTHFPVIVSSDNFFLLAPKNKPFGFYWLCCLISERQHNWLLQRPTEWTN